jgi:hypothetical protein
MQPYLLDDAIVIPDPSAARVTGLDPANGDVLWTRDVSGGGLAAAPLVQGAVVLNGDKLLLPFADGGLRTIDAAGLVSAPMLTIPDLLGVRVWNGHLLARTSTEMIAYTVPASATFRNPDVAGHTNPPTYSVTSLPVLGSTFTASIGTSGKAGCFLVGYSAPLTFPTAQWGNILVDFLDARGELLGMPGGLGDPTVIDLSVPAELLFMGFECATQAVRFGSGIDLVNAQDLVLGW